jgi:hypothetical protein
MDVEIITKNDARIVPGAYLLSDFKTTDRDVLRHMESIVKECSLNTEQERAFRIIANHSVSVTGEPLKMYIGGMGGTGKTQVIKALQQWFDERGEGHRMVVLAPTGAAASIIKRSTYHMFLGVRTGEHRSGKLPGGPSLDEAKIRMQGVDYVFIDEISMVSCQDFYCIDLQLKYITGLLDVPFGGINVVVAGDFAQLPPARPYSLYSGVVSRVQLPRQKPKELEETLGLLLWHQFVTVVILRQNMRQSSESPEDSKLRHALERMRYKSCNKADIDFLLSRIPAFNNTIDLGDEKWRDVAIITARNCHKDQINTMNVIRFSRENGRELHYFHSVDKQSLFDASKNKMKGTATTERPVRLTPAVQEALWSQEPHTSKHIAARLPLCIGMPVMIRYNEATELCVTKGQEAIVKGWTCYDIPGFSNRKALDTLFVELVRPPKDIKIPYLPKNIVPLAKMSTNVSAILPNDRTVAINRYQVPVLLNFAMTDYCAQGKTRPVNIVDLNESRSHQAIYTSLSRGKTAAETVILRPFALDKLQGGITGYLREEFRDLDLLDEITSKLHDGTLPIAATQSLRASMIAAYRTFQHVQNVTNEHDQNHLSGRPRTNGTHNGSDYHTPQGISITDGRVESCKRPWGDGPYNDARPVKRPRTSQNRATQGPALILQGCTWDPKDWSCAYDTYLTILKFIFVDTPEVWATDISQYSSYMATIHEAFSSDSSGKVPLNRIRNKLRKSFWAVDPISFPRGTAGTHVYSLVQAIHGMTVEGTGQQASIITCANCYQQSAGSPHESFDKYIAVQHDLDQESLKLSSYISKLQNPHGACQICRGNLYLNNNFRALICVQLPRTPVESASEALFIDPSFEIANHQYRLSSVVYSGEGDTHFEGRMVDKFDRVYRYDGMKAGGKVTYEFNLNNDQSVRQLNSLNHRTAALALYLAA